MSPKYAFTGFSKSSNSGGTLYLLFLNHGLYDHFVWEVIVFRIKKLQRMGYPGMPGRRDKGYQSKYFLKIFRNLLNYLLIFNFKNKFIMCPL